jgi:hypothetical protein
MLLLYSSTIEEIGISNITSAASVNAKDYCFPVFRLLRVLDQCLVCSCKIFNGGIYKVFYSNLVIILVCYSLRRDLIFLIFSPRIYL